MYNNKFSNDNIMYKKYELQNNVIKFGLIITNNFFQLNEKTM